MKSISNSSNNDDMIDDDEWLEEEGTLDELIA
jgi:hypothetical protein